MTSRLKWGCQVVSLDLLLVPLFWTIRDIWCSSSKSNLLNHTRRSSCNWYNQQFFSYPPLWNILPISFVFWQLCATAFYFLLANHDLDIFEHEHSLVIFLKPNAALPSYGRHFSLSCGLPTYPGAQLMKDMEIRLNNRLNSIIMFYPAQLLTETLQFLK